MVPFKSEPWKVADSPSPNSITKWLIEPSESVGIVNVNDCSVPSVAAVKVGAVAKVGASFAIVVSNECVPD